MNARLQGSHRLQPPLQPSHWETTQHIFHHILHRKNTEQYLTKILYRLTFVGSIFLAAIAILPVIFTKLGNLPPSAQIGGTSMLIVVGVALETMKQLESQLVKRHYKGFIKQ